MKIEYKFVTGENVSIEVYGEFEEIMLELDNELKNNNRKETRRHESLSLFDKDKSSEDIGMDVCLETLKNLDRDKLYDAIRKLKPQEQELVHKLYLDNQPMTQGKYAEMLGVTENAVQLRLAKTKKKLKSMIQLL